MATIITTAREAENFIYESYMKALPNIPPDQPDSLTRNPVFTRTLLDRLGKPDYKQYNILVTGSKGKGSVSRILSAILESHGYKTGLFTGPHLMNFRERIRVSGTPISERNFVKYTNHIEPYIHDIQQALPADKYIGPVGISAAIAMLYYLDKKTRYNIIECGRGARYDDVNMIFSRASIINSVFEEHIPQLGNNLLEIADSKAGVIKSTQDFTFSAHQNPEVLNIIIKETRDNSVKLYHYGRDFECSDIKVTPRGTHFNIATEKHKYGDLSIRLLGRHQAYNAALAISAAERILGKLNSDTIAKSLRKITWPGRLEIISRTPTVILDGCINKECSRYVTEVVKEITDKPIISIVGIPDDKDYIGVIQRISSISKKIILTKTKNRNLKFTDNQYGEIRRVMDENIHSTQTIDEAMDMAMSFAEADDIICIMGTISLVKETKELFSQDTLKL
ncbi:MAG: hypothetical protein GX352_09245 [Clostridiales bacterium]|nr:hypothetical protein [Clostridiales bacterium]